MPGVQRYGVDSLESWSAKSRDCIFATTLGWGSTTASGVKAIRENLDKEEGMDSGYAGIRERRERGNQQEAARGRERVRGRDFSRLR